MGVMVKTLTKILFITVGCVYILNWQKQIYKHCKWEEDYLLMESTNVGSSWQSNILKVSVVVIAALVMVLGFASVAEAQTLQHRVQPGESLWRISQRYGTSINELRRANSLWRTEIYPGETLAVPYSGSVHTVSSGESLFRIATWYETSVNEIQSLNRHYSTTIYPGQRLAIPESGTSRTNGTSRETEERNTGSSSGFNLSAGEIDLLARTVYSEAKGEPYEGQVAVAAVVLNRIRSSQFPDSVWGIVYQQGQFEPVMRGTIYQSADNTAFRAVRDALNGWDPSWGALYFFNPSKTSNAFMWSRPVIRTIGGHRFTN